MKTDKILITGTGRAGTTILVKLLSLCGFNTGFQMLNESDIERYVDPISRGGLEIDINTLTDVTSTQKAPLIIKAPALMLDVRTHAEKFNILKIYVPIRDLEGSAKSRVPHAYNPGGLWNATDLKSQMTHNSNGIYNLIYDATELDLDIEFISFKRFVNDIEYAWKIIYSFQISSGFTVDREKFNSIYDSIIDHTKIKTK